MAPQTHDPPYWELVNELMGLGWYRAGPGPAQDGLKTWGFREGHLIDAVQSGEALWIPARTEAAAMRLLLDEVRPQRPSRGSRRTRRRS